MHNTHGLTTLWKIPTYHASITMISEMLLYKNIMGPIQPLQANLKTIILKTFQGLYTSDAASVIQPQTNAVSIKGHKRLNQDSLLTFPGAPCLETIGFGALAGHDQTSSICFSQLLFYGDNRHKLASSPAPSEAVSRRVCHISIKAGASLSSLPSIVTTVSRTRINELTID